MERATRTIINLNAIASNVAAVRSIIGHRRDLMAVVKADAYGHGAVNVSRTALESGATCLGVAPPEEKVDTGMGRIGLAPKDTPAFVQKISRYKNLHLIATLPIGYGDGYSRGLSNRGYAMIRNQHAPLLGRVCMDMCMFDVTDIKDVQPGDEAVLFGERPTVDKLAHQLDTINYEIVCSIGKRVPKIFVT